MLRSPVGVEKKWSHATQVVPPAAARGHPGGRVYQPGAFVCRRPYRAREFRTILFVRILSCAPGVLMVCTPAHHEKRPSQQDLWPNSIGCKGLRNLWNISSARDCDSGPVESGEGQRRSSLLWMAEIVWWPGVASLTGRGQSRPVKVRPHNGREPRIVLEEHLIAATRFLRCRHDSVLRVSSSP